MTARPLKYSDRFGEIVDHAWLIVVDGVALDLNQHYEIPYRRCDTWLAVPIQVGEIVHSWWLDLKRARPRNLGRMNYKIMLEIAAASLVQASRT